MTRLTDDNRPAGQAVADAEWPPAVLLIALRRDGRPITATEETVLGIRESDHGGRAPAFEGNPRRVIGCSGRRWMQQRCPGRRRAAGVVNGRPYSLMDQITVFKLGEIRSCNGLQPRWATVMEMPPRLDLGGRVGPGRYYRDTMVS